MIEALRPVEPFISSSMSTAAMTPETERIIARMQDQFMQPEVEHAEYWEVSANHGETHIVPADVCPAAGDLAHYVEGRIDHDEFDHPTVELKTGWLARLSAPGYMDCTDWTAHETEDEAYEYLAETFGDDEDDDDLPEGKWSGPLGVPDRKD